jgi:U3 small nucleolar RNA-associated protein 15
VKETSAVTHLDFHPNNYVAGMIARGECRKALHRDFFLVLACFFFFLYFFFYLKSPVLVCAGPRVHYYDGTYPSADPMKTFSKFKGQSYGVSFRRDGLLMAVGGEEGRIRVYDSKTKNLMKQFFGHTGAIRLTKFCPDKVTVMSGGDDKTVRKWDLGTEAELFKSSLHTDYVRSGFVLESTPSVWVTGGYDKQVIGLDTRSEEKSFGMTVEHPVEQVLGYGNDSCVAIANGNNVCIYDLRKMGGDPLSILANHAKTVTCLATSDGESRLLTGSVDQTVKVWNVESDFECVLTQRFSAPVLCCGMAPSNQFFVVGMADGLISMQHRPPHKTVDPAREELNYKMRKGHGIDHKPERGDFRVPTANKIRRSKVDGFLRKYSYREALDASLEEKEATGMTISLISDLIDRRALDAALMGRDDESLVPICQFLHSNITKPFYDEICIDVLDRLMELYSSVFAQSRLLAAEFKKIQKKLDSQISIQTGYVEMLGKVETAAAEMKRNKQ